MFVAVELVKELLPHLFPTVDGLRLQVDILIKGNTLQCLDELLHHEAVVSPDILACLNEICNMLFWVTFPIKLLELGGLVIVGYVESINPLSVRLGVYMSYVRTSI